MLLLFCTNPSQKKKFGGGGDLQTHRSNVASDPSVRLPRTIESNRHLQSWRLPRPSQHWPWRRGVLLLLLPSLLCSRRQCLQASASASAASGRRQQRKGHARRQQRRRHETWIPDMDSSRIGSFVAEGLLPDAGVAAILLTRLLLRMQGQTRGGGIPVTDSQSS
jgi:hypothetical protein